MYPETRGGRLSRYDANRGRLTNDIARLKAHLDGGLATSAQRQHLVALSESVARVIRTLGPEMPATGPPVAHPFDNWTVRRLVLSFMSAAEWCDDLRRLCSLARLASVSKAWLESVTDPACDELLFGTLCAREYEQWPGIQVIREHTILEYLRTVPRRDVGFRVMANQQGRHGPPEDVPSSQDFVLSHVPYDAKYADVLYAMVHNFVDFCHGHIDTGMNFAMLCIYGGEGNFDQEDVAIKIEDTLREQKLVLDIQPGRVPLPRLDQTVGDLTDDMYLLDTHHVVVMFVGPIITPGVLWPLCTTIGASFEEGQFRAAFKTRKINYLRPDQSDPYYGGGDY